MTAHDPALVTGHVITAESAQSVTWFHSPDRPVEGNTVHVRRGAGEPGPGQERTDTEETP